MAQSASISILTALLPSSADFIAETGQSVQAAKQAAFELGQTMEWIVAIDGPGKIPTITGADKILYLRQRSGVSAARNHALSASTGTWVMPLDADDLIDGQGVAAVIKSIELNSSFGWIVANRLLMDGRKTPHWKDTAQEWEAGKLAETWTAPFAFHPNSIVVKREIAIEIGGWPALSSNEDLAFILAVSEICAGCFMPSVLTQYRVWDKQSVADPAYIKNKQGAFEAIAASLNEKRQATGRKTILAPSPGGAFGILGK